MISSNLIQSDDESVINIGENCILQKRNKKSMKLALTSWINSRLKRGEISKNRKNEITEIKTEI